MQTWQAYMDEMLSLSPDNWAFLHCHCCPLAGGLTRDGAWCLRLCAGHSSRWKGSRWDGRRDCLSLAGAEGPHWKNKVVMRLPLASCKCAQFLPKWHLGGDFQPDAAKLYWIPTYGLVVSKPLIIPGYLSVWPCIHPKPPPPLLPLVT